MKGERQRREEWDVEESGEAAALLPPLGLRAAPGSSGRRWWGRTVLWAVFAIVLIECAFIVRLDILNSPATSTHAAEKALPGRNRWVNASATCSAAWLERVDRVLYARDFNREPVVVAGGEDQSWEKCAVPCVFRTYGGGKADAAFGDASAPLKVLRSMESETYFPENGLDSARRSGVAVVMTTSLASDVPVGYFSWAEYPIMDPVKPKTQKALGAAFISNCGAHNDRLAIMRTLQQEGVAIDSYGACDQNKPGGRGLNKVEALREYKFSLAFENSNVEDYVTEKFFQALVAGSVPIVTGPPNIYDFAPSSNSLIYIKDRSQAKAAAERIKYLAKNETAYNETLSWKFVGPSDQFLALVDMAAVHSSCRLCIHLATKIRLKEEASAPTRPCKCTGLDGRTLYHLYVRERGRFNMESIFIKDSELSVTKLKKAVAEKFTSLNHVPIWKTERPQVIRGNSDLRVYKIYPVGLTQREALYSWDFGGDKGLKSLVKKEPCLQLEVIFV